MTLDSISVLRYYRRGILLPWIAMGVFCGAAFYIGVPGFISGWGSLVGGALMLTVLYSMVVYKAGLSLSGRKALRNYIYKIIPPMLRVAKSRL